jgi:hypothetical protein
LGSPVSVIEKSRSCASASAARQPSSAAVRQVTDSAGVDLSALADTGSAGASAGIRDELGGPDGGGAHGDPTGMALGDPAGAPIGAPIGGPDIGRLAGPAGAGGADTGDGGGPDTGATGGADTDATSSTAGSRFDSPLPPFTPLICARIGDGRRVRNQADSTARKIGSSIVSSGRGRTSALPLLAGWPLPAGCAAAGSQSSRTRGISSVMSSAGENPLPAAGGGPAGPLCATAGSAPGTGGHAGGADSGDDTAGGWPGPACAGRDGPLTPEPGLVGRAPPGIGRDGDCGPAGGPAGGGMKPAAWAPDAMDGGSAGW